MIPSRLKTWLLRLIAAVAMIYASYLLLANLLLLSGALELMINRRPQKYRLEWSSAWTVLPGRVHVSGFSMAGQTRKSQWLVDVDRGVVDVRLLALLAKGFHAQRVHTEGVRFWFRRQWVPGEPQPQGRELEPAIPGMPDQRPALELIAPRPKRRFPWTIRLDNIVVQEVNELWLSTYRITGGGDAAGSMRYTIGGKLEIPAVRLSLPAANVFSGELQVGRELVVDLVGELAPCEVQGRRLVQSLPFLVADFDLRGAVADFGFLNLYFVRLPSLNLRGAGDVDCHIALDRGKVGTDSRITFDSQRISVLLKDYEIDGRGAVQITIDPESRARMVATVNDIGVAGGGRAASASEAADEHLSEQPLQPFDIDAGDACALRLEALSSIADLSTPFADITAVLELPDCRLDDLTSLNNVVPSNMPVVFLPNSNALIMARLDLSEDYGEGELQLRGRRIAASLNELPVVGDAVFDLQLRAIDPQELVFDVSGSRLLIENLEHGRAGGAGGADWWAGIELEDAELRLSLPMTLNATVVAAMSDTEPLIAAYVPAEQVDLLTALFDLEDIRADARVQLSREGVEIEDLSMVGSGLGRSILGGAGSLVSVASNRLDLERGFDGLIMDLDLPETEIPDLALFNEFIPESSGILFETGSAGVISGELEVREKRLSGFAEINARGIGVQLCNLSLLADLAVHLKMPEARLESRSLDLSGTRVFLDDVLFPVGSDSPQQGWWAEIEVEEGVAVLGDSVAVEAMVGARLRDTRPVIAAYLPAERAGVQLEDLLNIESVSVHTLLAADSQRLSFSGLQISGRGTAAGHLRGPGFMVDASNVAVDLDGGFTALDLSLVLPPSELVDLATFNNYIPAKSGLAFQPGSDGMVSASLEVKDGIARGQADVGARGIGLKLGHTSVVGDLDLKVKLDRGDLQEQRFDIGGSSLTIDEAMLPGSDTGQGGAWWARVDLSRGAVELSRPIQLETTLYLEMGDSRPLVGLISGAEGNPWLEDLLNINEVLGRIELSMNEDAVTLRELEVRGLGRTGDGILGPGLKIAATGSDVDLNQGLEGLELEIELPESEVRDLGIFNKYLPETSGVSLLSGGRGTISANLHLEAGRGGGAFELRGRDFGAIVGETTVRGDLSLEVLVSAADLEDPTFEISGSRLHLDNVHIVGGDGREHEDWWAKMHLDRAEARMAYPLSLEAEVKLDLADTWPLVAYGSDLSRVVRLARRLLVVDNISGTSKVVIGSDDVVFDELALQGDGFESQGRVRLFKGGNEGILFFKLRGLSAALWLDENGRKWKLFRPRRWYEKTEATVVFSDDG